MHLIHRQRRAPAPATWADRCRAQAQTTLAAPRLAPNQLSWRCTAATRAPARHAIAMAEQRAESASSPSCAPPPAPSSPANSPPARPSPPPLPIKGTARPFAREPARRPAISAATQAPPWSHRLATPLSNPSKPRPASPHTGPLQRILKCPEPPDSPRSAAAAQYRRRDPPNDEPPSPAFLHTNQPIERKLLGLLKLSDPSATSFPHRNMNAGDQTRRRPPLSVEPPLRTTSARPKTTGR